jgi:hypothetical protein
MNPLVLAGLALSCGASHDGASGVPDSGGSADSATSADSAASSDSATSSDSDSVPDSDQTWIWPAGTAMGSFETTLFVSSGRFTAGDQAYRWRNQSGDVLCEMVGSFSVPAGGQADCPTCDWSFSMVLDNMVMTGEYCSALGYYSWVDYYIENANDGGIQSNVGFASQYELPSGESTLYSVIFEENSYTWARRFWNDPTQSRYQVYVAGPVVFWRTPIYYFYYYSP